MGVGQLRWENRKLTSGENLKSAKAHKLTPSSSILIVYPHLNQGEWVGLQGQQKINSICGVFKQKNKICQIQIWRMR